VGVALGEADNVAESDEDLEVVTEYESDVVRVPDCVAELDSDAVQVPLLENEALPDALAVIDGVVDTVAEDVADTLVVEDSECVTRDSVVD
jgi:hypothetical protein